MRRGVGRSRVGEFREQIAVNAAALNLGTRSRATVEPMELSTAVLVGAAEVCGAVFIVTVLVMWLSVRNVRLRPPSVRGLSEIEGPRYLDLVTESAQRCFEGLGFRRAGYLALQPTSFETADEIARLMMRNDETRTVAYLHVRSPFTEARPVGLAFDSFLADGSCFTTSDGPPTGPPLPYLRYSRALDHEAVYREHLAALAQLGLATGDVPATFEGLVAANVADVARLWQARRDQGLVVPAGDGAFRYGAWRALAAIPVAMFVLFKRTVLKVILGPRRNLSVQEQNPVALMLLPEIEAFLDQARRRQKEGAEVAARRFKESRSRTVLLWGSGIIAFVVVWRLLNHRPR